VRVPVITGRTAALSESAAARSSRSIASSRTRWARALVAVADSRDRREGPVGARPQLGLRRSRGSAPHRESLEIYREPPGRGWRGSPRSHTGMRLRWRVFTRQRRAPKDRHCSHRRRSTSSWPGLPFLRFDPKLWDARQPYAPLGALYAAACVRDRGYRAGAVRRDARGIRDRVGRRARSPSSAGRGQSTRTISTTLSKMCLLRMRQAALTMIDAARERGIITIVAGADATDHPVTYLDRGAAVVVTGEGEVTLVELLDTLVGSTGQAGRVGQRSRLVGCLEGGRRALPARRRRPGRAHGGAHDHPPARLAAVSGVGPRRRRAVPLHLAVATTATSP